MPRPLKRCWPAVLNEWYQLGMAIIDALKKEAVDGVITI